MNDKMTRERVAEIVAEMRAAMRRDEDGYRDAAFLDDMSGYIRDLDKLCARARPRPTLADMNEEERDECRWMQCDVQGQAGAWLIVAPFDDDDEDYAHVVGRQGSKSWGFPAERITPRPDLPRMEWTSDTTHTGPKITFSMPAPALPGGWRLADHPKHGRVIVTRPDPDEEGEAAIIRTLPARPSRAVLTWCDSDELTYLDQEADQ